MVPVKEDKTPESNGPTLLVADDDQQTCAVCRDVGRALGLRVLVASSTEAGLSGRGAELSFPPLSILGHIPIMV